MIKKVIKLVVVFICFFNVTACDKGTISTEKKSDIDFTIMEEADVPDELDDIIKGKKEKKFKLSYSDKENTYIVVGYGEQSTGGYSITVDELFLTENAIYINTTLVGPEENELVLKAKTYPYIVVKIEYMDKNIVFDE